MKSIYWTYILLALVSLSACYKIESPEQMLSATGLSELQLESGKSYLGKTHRGYPIMVTGEAPNVWLRFGARLAASQVSTELELGRTWEFILGGSRRPPVGSPFDRLLSQVLGRPLTLVVILKHEKPDASRLDIFSNFSGLAPSDTPPKVAVLQRQFGIPVSSLHSGDASLAEMVRSDNALLARLEKFRSFYIRLDNSAVSFVFAGDETEFSQMLADHEYQSSHLYNSVFDSLADIADKVS